MPDQGLQYVAINDFTPGMHRHGRVSTPLHYSPNAPLGSAAHTYRCVARPSVGLVPLPSYKLVQTHKATDATQPVCLSMGNMASLAARGGAVGDLISAILIQHGHPEVKTEFNFTRLPLFMGTNPGYVPGDGFTPIVLYTNSTTTPTGPAPGYAWPFNTTSWPFMDYATFKDPNTNAYARVVLTTDPISTSLNSGNGTTGIWLCARGWTTPTRTTAPEFSQGTFTLIGAIGSYPRIFYHAYRMGIWQATAATTATNGWIATDTDQLSVSNQLDPRTIIDAGVFFPELGSTFGAWGSISSGEFIAIYHEGGAVLIYGDLYAPQQNMKLPGVAGTMGLSTHAALTNIGLIYCRFNEGAWVWNGDNQSTKISTQIQDDQFDRPKQAQGFQASPVAQTSLARLGSWVVFPGNFLLDTLTGSWWFLEDPTVIACQVWCENGAQWIFGCPGIAYAAAGATATLSTYGWDFGTASSSYYWLSNPLPVTQDALVSIQQVEIVASNATTSDATITIQPAVPSGQRLFQQQNETQTLVFTIPHQTAAYRASLRLGFTDYNIQLAVTAANSNTNNAAPILHSINVGYVPTRPAGIQ